MFADNDRKKHGLVQGPGKMSPFMGFQVSFLAVKGEARIPGGMAVRQSASVFSYSIDSMSYP